MKSIKKGIKADSRLKWMLRGSGQSLNELCRQQYTEARERDWHSSM